MSRDQLVVQLPVTETTDFDMLLYVEETLFRSFPRSDIAEVDRHEDAPAPIPPSVLAWHAEHQEALEQVRHVLLTWKPPRWEEDLLDAAKAPLPNLLGLTQLCKILRKTSASSWAWATRGKWRCSCARCRIPRRLGVRVSTADTFGPRC